MSYQSVLLYTQEGVFVGYSILGPNKLQTTNVYSESEVEALNERVSALNGDVSLKAHWPSPQDPEVLAILADDSFMPIAYVEADVVDEDKSYYVYEKVAGEIDGQAAWVDGDHIDEEASVIVTKKAMIPKNPSDVMLRIKGASEIVARRRASATV